jgi:TRAP-type C4-dicarboxylate transport system permease small subunit
MMDAYLKTVSKLSTVMYAFSAVVLSFMMLLTVSDVILRYLGRPIPGTYELVGLSGAIAIGFAIPYTSLVRGHVFVEFLIDRMEKGRREVVLIFTKILILLLFIAFGTYLFITGMDMAASGEVTQILRLPFYPVAYAVGVACFIECLVMVSDIVKLAGGDYE